MMQPLWSPPSSRWRRSLWLCALTFISLLLAGARAETNASIKELLWMPELLLHGLPYAAALSAITLVREVARYGAARWHGVAPSLPYYLPAPTLFGTMGAAVVIRQPLKARKVLFDMSAAASLALIASSLLAIILGVMSSHATEATQSSPFMLGDSWALRTLLHALRPAAALTDVSPFHPLIFAGWTGLLMAVLGGLPLNAVDGGHIAHALLGTRGHKWLSMVTVVILGALAVRFHSPIWLLWPIVLVAIGTPSAHVSHESPPLGVWRQILAVALLLIPIALFVPIPVGLAMMKAF